MRGRSHDVDRSRLRTRLIQIVAVIVTASAFVMALYFTNLAALLKIGGFMFFVAAFLSGYGNWLPQVEGGFPLKEEKLDFSSMTPQQLADEGEKIIFGGIGQSSTQGAIGKGQCPLCHGFQKGFLSERAPNLFGLPDRLKERLEDPRYHKGKPGERDTAEKESFAGSGTAELPQEYIAESHACPSCYVVSGFGVKGTNDKESPMPKIHKPPISLSLPELAAVDTWLYVREGREAPSFEEIVKSYEKFIPEADRPKMEEEKPAGAASALLALIFAAGARINLLPNDWGARYAQAVLSILPKNAVVIVTGDPDLAPLAYFHMIENRRPDITLVEPKGLILGNRLFHPLRTSGEAARRIVEQTIDQTSEPVGFTLSADPRYALRDRWLSPVTTEDGLPDDRITALVSDPTTGDAWVGTARGLARWLAFVEVVEPVEEVGVDDGVAADEVAGMQVPSLHEAVGERVTDRRGMA